MKQGFYTKTKQGHTAHVLGDQNIPVETLEAIHEMINIAQRKFTRLGDDNKTHKQNMAEEKDKSNSYDSSTDTLLHIRRVNELLNNFSIELMQRAIAHDKSKLQDPEKSEFDRLTPILKQLEYGTQAYKDSLSELQGALKHHYENNSHHPEHYENGINGMDLFDIVEMFMDWKAATERTKDGNISKSLLINKDRFEISDQLVSVFENTIINYNWKD